MASLLTRLEQYTLKYPQEVLQITAWEQGTEESVLIFRGFSSSLTRSTAFDPDVPILSDRAEIRTIDRLVAPYNPEQPQYLAQGLSLAAMLEILAAVGL
ncbi:MAG: hypothetical protein AAGG51_06885 [Cyanobacteria bacterium P01_G01_bin.54]